MKNTAIFLSLLCAAYAQVCAQAAGNYEYQQQMQQAQHNNWKQNAAYRPTVSKDANAVLPGSDDVLIFQVKALKNVAADSQMAIFNVTQVGKDAAEADSLMARRYKGMIGAVKKLGISEKNIFVDMVSQVPLFEYEVSKKLFSKNYNEVPSGIELQKNIHILYKDGNMLDKIVAIAAQNEIYDLVKVEYFVPNSEAIYAELRKKSAECLRQKVAGFKELGINLDTVYRMAAEDIAVVYPSGNYENYQGYSSSSLEALKKTTGVTSVRKPSTMFFNKLPYEQFDIVLNPVFIEPPVQFTYDLKVRYTVQRKPIERTKTEVKREFLWLTPQGEVKSLKVE